MSLFETITSNIRKIAAETYYAYRDGRKYLVAPMNLIVPGVLPGSKGPLYYPPQEIARTADAWNGVPLVLNHPKSLSGENISAYSDGVVAKHGLGFVTDSHVDSKQRLRATGWFDVERTGALAPDILSALQSGKPVELSTGLFTDNAEAPQGSNVNGRSYTHIAKNYRPDHVAILTHEVGACTIQDGCGVLVNSRVSVDRREDRVSKREDSKSPILHMSNGAVKTTSPTATQSSYGANFVNPMVDVVEVPATGIGPLLQDRAGLPEVEPDPLGDSLNDLDRTVALLWPTYDGEDEEGEDGEEGDDEEEVLNVEPPPVTPIIDNPTSPVVPEVGMEQVSELLMSLLHLSTAARLIHVSSTCYATHKSVKGLMTKLPKKVDKAIEVWQAHNQLISVWPDGFVPPSTDDPLSFLASVRDYVEDHRDVLGDKGGIQDIVDDIGIILSRAIYRLRFLTCHGGE